MGCFSFLCKESGKPALSTSFDGSPCHLFLLKDGEVLEHMFGNYNSYGQVFKQGKEDSYEWKMDWGDVCDLMFNKNKGDGIAMILHDYYTGKAPTTQSDNDPNQGWGSEEDGDEDLMGDTSSDKFVEVTNPFHKVVKEVTLPEKDQTIVLANGKAIDIDEAIKEVTILANGEAIYKIKIVGSALEIKLPHGGLSYKTESDNLIRIESE